MSGRIVVRGLLTLAGVAATSAMLLLSATELSIAAQGERPAAWIASSLFIGAMVLGWLTVWAAAGHNALGSAGCSTRARRRLTSLGVLTVVQLLGTTLLLAHRPSNPNAGPAIVLPFLLVWGCDAALILGALCVLSLRPDADAEDATLV